MNFTSFEFLVFFPLVLVLYWILPRKYRWFLLLAASWLFYFRFDAFAGFFLVLTTAVSWFCARQIEKGTRKKLWLSLALLEALGSLVFFKYTHFFASLAGLELPLQILLPVGISFYTFQTLSYVIDVYRGRAHAEHHFGLFALFVSFFPQLVAGPIERPEKLLPQLKEEHLLSGGMLSEGGWLLLRGYIKKIVIADGFAPIVDAVFDAPAVSSGPAVLAATVLFGFQIYCDFSGYTDIARGAAKMMGIDLSENFNRPYLASSIRDFWRRWHMSLTGWFTDYVYIPLGGSRRGLKRHLLNVMIVFLLSGLWHGAGWNFILWGALHGIFLCVEILLFREERPATVLGRGVTFLLVSFAWIFFRSPDLSTANLLLSRLGSGWTTLSIPDYTPRALLSILCLALLGRVRKPGYLTVFMMLFALALSWLAILASGGENAFIYFQF